MREILLALLMLPLAPGAYAQNEAPGRIVTFRFVSGDGMFYIPWGGNDAELNRLYSLVDEYRIEIIGGKMPIYVDGYCASLSTAKENLNTAFIRANRVKSELITHKGLLEENFITKNYAGVYEGHKDMVVVTLRIPAAKEEPRQPQPAREEPERKVPPVAEKQKSDPIAEPQPEPQLIVAETVAPSKPYCFALRTNLLYDAFLLPTLGVEWRVSPAIGVKIDGSRSGWGNERGKIQKIWLVNPEVRWYMGVTKRFYVGASANLGEYNLYKGLIGNFISDDTGYQGKLWNAGLTAGYQLHLFRSFSLDFNLGLGYTSLEYDNFNMINEVRVYKEKDKTKDFFGPTQAGISLIWTLGGK